MYTFDPIPVFYNVIKDVLHNHSTLEKKQCKEIMFIVTLTFMLIFNLI